MKPISKSRALGRLRRRIHKAQLSLERSVAKVEEASRAPGEAEDTLPKWREWLWGAKESAIAAITKLQQMQARWVELELDLLRDVTDEDEEAEKHLGELDLDTIEREIGRLRQVAKPKANPDGGTPSG